MKTEIGGDRLGSGNKQEVSMRNFERSSHDLGYIWRSSMAAGTLVPFMSEVGLPGDSFDIDLDVDVKTLPTTGPLYGGYKVQLDVFQCPIRLYQGKLHMNMLNVGLDMSTVRLPQLDMKANYDPTKGDNQQINPSSIFSYLNIRGLGRNYDDRQEVVHRDFNAVPYLGYWDIYKQYYANKQEERGMVIHGTESANGWAVNEALLIRWQNSSSAGNTMYSFQNNTTTINTQLPAVVQVQLTMTFATGQGTAYGTPDVNDVKILIGGTVTQATSVFNSVVATEIGPMDGTQYKIFCNGYTGPRATTQTWNYTAGTISNTASMNTIPEITEFPLDNIDDMRMDILEAVRQVTPFMIDKDTQAPYGLSLGDDGQETPDYYSKQGVQEGLGLKTYQSDLFNNWISTEWIDGTNGINEVTAVSTVGDEFTIDALNLANKVYNMLNRIAISGGSYDDWLDAVYTHERAKGHENPIYHGSLIKELGFQEVVSNAESGDSPLGTLAGRGSLTGKHKGGKVKIKVDEPSYVMGIISITPRIDYSQGNKWDVNLKTMNDLHKPSLDAIGYQDLITDQMAWFDTPIDEDREVLFQSAGKQPAWVNYMTNVNQCRGDFAEENNSMFMTLNRKYEQNQNSGTTEGGIKDLTTYIDPSKYNSVWAESSLSGQNFWVQISNKIFARRKMSAKVIPNL